MQENPSLVDPGLGFFEKVRLLAACGVSILLLRTVGWELARPADPQMAVTLSGAGAAILRIWPSLAVLAAICAVIGTVVIGKRLPQAGALVAGVAIAAMSIRGGTMQVLLGYEAGTQTDTRRALMSNLLIDCVLWTGIMAVAWITCIMVHGWLWPSASPVEELPATEPAKSGAQGTGKSSSLSKDSNPAVKSQLMGAFALAVTVGVALIVISNTVARTSVAMIEQNQVIASVAGGLFLGAMAGRYFTGVTEPLFYVLAPPIVAVIAFILGYLSSDMSWAQGPPNQYYAQLATTPPHDLVRPLPVLYLTVGVAGALGGYWTADRMERLAQQESM